MPAKVFISCGQANDEEKDVARAVADWLHEAGFMPYVAIEAQSMQDVNSGIIDELKSADYYLFIDFRRDKLSKTENTEVFRGSLFTHQELAIAYVLEFPNAIFLRQEGTELSGLGKYMLTNAKEFSCATQVLDLVKQLITERKWSPGYSRHLVGIEVLKLATVDHDRHMRKDYHWYVLVQNRRDDVRARCAVARLVGISSDNRQEVSVSGRLRGPLRWLDTRFPGSGPGLSTRIHELPDGGIKSMVRLSVETEVDILPGDERAFSAFSVWSGSGKEPEDLFTVGRVGLALQPGVYRLKYEVGSENLPPCWVVVEGTFTGDAERAVGRLEQ